LHPNSASQLDYERRINRAMDYINRHLDEDLSLEALAREAAFSPYHFHRIFTAMVGEPVAAFIRRLRLERAAADLVAHPLRSVTETAQRNGFASPAVFARAFRERFGMTATAWRTGRRKECKVDRNPDQTPGKESKALTGAPRYALPSWVARRPGQTKETTMEVRIEEMPAVRAAYVRRAGEYGAAATGAWQALCRWAGPRGLLTPGRMLFSVSHDDPTVTPPDKLRYDACIAIDADTSVDAQVGVMELPARRVAKARYAGPGKGILGAYQAFYGEWLPESGFVPASMPPIEVYLPEEGNRPEADRFVMDICVPIIPA
jgi:AraC family transcriptional regulator